MRSSRLLTILLLLQTRGRLTARQLADELEVSLRTMYRDVEALSAAGVPVYAERGPTGGYALLNGYRTRLTGLTTEEADSLFLAGLPGPAAELGLGAELATAQLKLLAALPGDLRDRAERVRERFHLDAPGWFHDDPTPQLAAVASAVWEQRGVAVRYLRAGRAGERQRRLQPLGVVLKAGVWYLVARVAGAEAHQLRVYRVSRILELELLDERFERPADFTLSDFWDVWSARYQANLYRGAARVRLSPHGVAMLPYLLGALEARAAHANAGPPDARGWITTTLPIESIQHAHAAFLKLGADLEVLEPAELRERVRATARALTELYRERGAAMFEENLAESRRTDL
jgi:predicted DNA-binding transcriptional regulator YafY